MQEPVLITSALVRSAIVAPSTDLDAWCEAIAGEAMARFPASRAAVAVFEPSRIDRVALWVHDALARHHRLHEPLNGALHAEPADGVQALSTLGNPVQSAFVRVAAPVRETETPRTIAMQIERTDREPFPDWAPTVLRAVAETCASAYAHSFGLLADHRGDLLSRLNTVQRLIAPLLIEGRSESQVAQQIGRSQHTVHDHVKRVYNAWGVRSRREMRDLWYRKDPSHVSRR